MSKLPNKDSIVEPDALFGRIVSILEQARGNVIRAVNTNMVVAYWLIGREIVEGVQGGDVRAEYGKKVIEALSKRLTVRFGKGYSVTNLWYFKQFYVAFSGRLEIPRPSGGECSDGVILHPMGGENALVEFPQTSGPKDPRPGSPWPHPGRGGVAGLSDPRSALLSSPAWSCAWWWRFSGSTPSSMAMAVRHGSPSWPG